MTFWQFFNESPIVGLLFGVTAIVVGGMVFETLVTHVASVFRAKYGGCDCVPCDREHVEEEESADDSGKDKET